MTDEDDPRTTIVRADALLLAGRASEAVAELEGATAEGVPRAERLARLARAEAAAGDAAAMRATVRQIQGDAAGTGSEIANAFVLLGDLEGELGNRDRAYEAYGRATEIDPEGNGLAAAYAFATSVGDAHRAGTIRRRMCQNDPAAAGCDTPTDSPE